MLTRIQAIKVQEKSPPHPQRPINKNALFIQGWVANSGPQRRSQPLLREDRGNSREEGLIWGWLMEEN